MQHIHCFWRRAVALPVIFAWAIPANANSLQPATFTESVSAGCFAPGPGAAVGTDDFAAELVSLDKQAANSTAACQAVVSAATVGGTAPQIDLLGQANATYLTLGTSSTVSAAGRIDYALTLSGPASAGTIAMRVQALLDISGSASENANVVARGEVVLPATSATVVLCSYFGLTQPPFSCQFGIPNGDSLAVDRLVALRPNETYIVSMRANATATATADEDVTSSAADFQVVVDPIFSFVNEEDAALYSLEFSPNLVPVPLPAGAWLFGSALALIAALRRRSVR